MQRPASASFTGALLPGRWFDGLSSRARPVLVGLQATPEGPALVLHPLSCPDAAPNVFGHAEVDWPETWDLSAQRCVVLDLREQGSLEIDAPGQWRAALAACGQRPGIVQRMQTRWPWLLGMGAVAAIGLALVFRYGTPWVATQLTRWVPLAWERSVAERALEQLERGPLRPSQLPQERQAQLRARFAALARQPPPGLLRYPGYRPQWALEFRSGIGANAFALPGGQVVLSDQIVRAAAANGLDDNALLGVLAHEIGHVMQRHGTRNLVQQGVLGMGLGLALGDMSGMLTASAYALTSLAYSRDHEREADCYALALMGYLALPTAPMGQLLLGIAQDEQAQAKDEDPSGIEARASAEAAGRRHQETSGPHPAWSLLSTHPGTAQRAMQLQRADMPHCAP